ncbi:hypothetical protein [Parablautia muri]|uniref:hypothetical protein n=1 Tax=Parablautia muri TaxID=2320879 RepID=UPI001371F088|nr:hypothetical protein [Parablautia muri]
MYKSQPPYYGLHPPYAAVCYFRRQAGRPDKGNYLESGKVISHDQPSAYTHIMQKRQRLLTINNN